MLLKLKNLLDYLEEKHVKEAEVLKGIVTNAGWNDYPDSTVPSEFPSTKAVTILSRHNYDMSLIELFQELGLPPGSQTEDKLTRKNFDYSYQSLEKELGGFGNFFYIRPEKDDWGRVMLTDKGMKAVQSVDLD